MALAFDGAGNGRTGSATSLSYSLSTSGSNRILLVQIMQNGTDDITAVTYAGVGMTLLYSANLSGLMFTYVYVQYAPTTGANNVSISKSTPAFIGSVGISYNNAAQSGNFLGITNNGASSGLTATSVTVPTSYTNSWIAGFGEVGSGANPSAGSGTIRRVINLTDGNSGFDSNGSTGTVGNYTLNMNWTGSSSAYMQGIELVDLLPTAPPSAGGTFPLMGV